MQRNLQLVSINNLTGVIVIRNPYTCVRINKIHYCLIRKSYLFAIKSYIKVCNCTCIYDFFASKLPHSAFLHSFGGPCHARACDLLFGRSIH